jgi:CubicO group peptidase (beta-lactamase class C family)
VFKPLNRPGAPLALAGLLALVALAGPIQAQDAARMDRLVQASADADAFSGSVLVARDGQIVLDQGYGLANREGLIPNESDTKFRLGSLTKQFTAGISPPLPFHPLPPPQGRKPSEPSKRRDRA